MDRVEQRFREYCERYEREGAGDPVPYLADLEADERAELSALIEFFLAESGPRRWDPDAYEGSAAEQAVERAMAEVGLASVEPWSSFLPALRNAARIQRDALAEQLATGLGFPASAERVRFYYHHMERGNLPAAGVSDRVLECLAGILGVSRDRLRQSGEAQGPPPDPEIAHVFARRPTGAHDHGSVQARLTPDLSGDEEVDRLFTGEVDERD